MGVYSKQNGQLKKIAGNLVQRVVTKWFLCTRSIENGIEYYDVPREALAYYNGLKSNKLYTFGFDTPNTTINPMLRYNGQVMTIVDITNEERLINPKTLKGVFNMYTEDVSDGKIYFVGTTHPDASSSVNADGVTIKENSDGNIQAEGLTDGTDVLTYAQIKNALTIRRRV